MTELDERHDGRLAPTAKAHGKLGDELSRGDRATDARLVAKVILLFRLKLRRRRPPAQQTVLDFPLRALTRAPLGGIERPGFRKVIPQHDLVGHGEERLECRLRPLASEWHDQQGEETQIHLPTQTGGVGRRLRADSQQAPRGEPLRF